MDTKQQPTRRGFLDAIIAVFSLIAAMAMGIPGVLYLWPAARGDGSESMELEGAAGMQVGDSRSLQIAGRVVIVVRHRSGFKAFSASCTHLGCLVTWERDRNEFSCPCHAAVFDADGKVVSGPPPQPLPEYAVKEIGDKVFVMAQS